MKKSGAGGKEGTDVAPKNRPGIHVKNANTRGEPQEKASGKRVSLN